MTPGWKYNLNAVKDIRVTEDFYKLDNIGCSVEPYDNCTTRIYVERVISKCGCLPFSMQFGDMKDKVLCIYHQSFIIDTVLG